METSISFGLVDATAKPDSTFSTADKQPFIDMQELKRDELEIKRFATLERDYFRLDGTFELFPDNPTPHDFGLWSASMSDENGDFETPIVLTVEFTEQHSSLGLTFTFHETTGDYCDNLNVKWYGAALLSDINYKPDSTVYFADNEVDGYRKIVITFYSTIRPYRYLKLVQLDFGQIKLFADGDLISANVFEEIDPISSELRINTLDFTLYSENAEFSILNPQGIFTRLQQRQPLRVHRYLDGVKKNVGTYYLDEWENEDEHNINMKAIDLVGVIDGTKFMGGMYNGVTAATIVQQIMASADAEFQLHSSLVNIILSGYIPICTHREALQQVAFAIGAIVDCSRYHKIKIYPVPDAVSGVIGKDRKFEGHKLKLKQLVTGVEVTAHKYIAVDEVVELLNDNLSTGTYEVTFNEPVHSLSIIGATITSSGVNYARINVISAGNVILTGKKYTDSKQIYGAYNTNLAIGEKANVLTVESATLISNSNAQAVAQRVYDYYQQRHQDDGEILLKNEECGQLVEISSLNNQKIKGIVEKLDIDLTGGFIANATITGGVVQ